jgi:hypothetical protein
MCCHRSGKPLIEIKPGLDNSPQGSVGSGLSRELDGRGFRRGGFSTIRIETMENKPTMNLGNDEIHLNSGLFFLDYWLADSTLHSVMYWERPVNREKLTVVPTSSNWTLSGPLM